MTIPPSGIPRRGIPRFADLALGRKLTLLFTVVSGTALALFAGALWEYQSEAYRRELRQEMSTLSKTLADSGAAALAFRDNRSAAETLAVLRAEPRVSAACLYRTGDVRSASYPAAMRESVCPSKPGPDGIIFSDRALTIVQTSRLQGDAVGQLWMSVDLADLYLQLRRLGLICMGALAIALLLAAIVASLLQRLISGPILGLAAVASRVSIDGDYSIRARRVSEDELGVLVEKFNEMMEQIYQRDLALERAHDELEERVRDRTRELSDEIATRRIVEQDLLTAKEAAEESNRAKGAFLATMSHELRTPLNAIIGYTEILAEDATAEGNGQVLADLDCVLSAARHLLSLINDILDFSKIEAGRMEIHPEPATARSVIADVPAMLQPLARKNANEFVTDLPDEDYVVNVDAMRFRQSLINLLSNACKFTEHGRVSLGVGREVSESGNWICFEVRDTGPGIARDGIEKLFKPFSQVDSSATRRHGGTGLGLAISQRFCRLMGGEISVESEPGKGSTFTIRLPEYQDGAVAPTMVNSDMASVD
jgi:signal transduction histidine kinase